ncbi:MAG: acyl carrier protein [Deltaproteobacteria bacterium]|nr:acyl carrier protein [Deltaproteobacteria bacterium]
MTELKAQLKRTLVTELNLEDIAPEDIDDNAPLFGDGLGLDSLDAVEIVVLVQRAFGVEIRNMDEGRQAFQSITALAEFIAAHRA